MSNRSFLITMAALVVAIFLAQWLVSAPRRLAPATPNALLLSSLKDERDRLATMVAAGCTSSALRADGAALEAYQAGPGAAGAPPLPAIDGRSLKPEQLAALLDTSVALIISKQSHGSGFFVSPELVVTNRHVVEDAGGILWVTSKALGKVIKAELISKTRSSEVGQPDFALLRLTSPVSGTPLAIAGDVTRLSPVVAAGYPGIVMRTDPRLARLLNGDPSQAPETVLAPGEVSVTQPQTNGVKLVIHTADISPGNSGGPLVDRCGRVVGVNTFVSKNSEYASRVLYALSSADLANFLRTNGVTFNAVAGRCETVVNQ